MIYQYECPGDGTTIEVERKITDPEDNYFCSTCTTQLRRVWSSPTIVFNAPGFYSTDSKH
jgi:predicted nucleic acid-binding Zn ribbon protein